MPQKRKDPNLLVYSFFYNSGSSRDNTLSQDSGGLVLWVVSRPPKRQHSRGWSGSSPSYVAGVLLPQLHPGSVEKESISTDF